MKAEHTIWGHCRNCQHEWQIARAPINLTRFAELLKAMVCPQCNADSSQLEAFSKP